MVYLIPPSHRGISRPIQDRASRLLRKHRVSARMLTTSSSSSANRSASACSNSSDSARGAAFRNAEKIRSKASVATVDGGASSVLAASLNAVAPGVFRPGDNGCSIATLSNSGFYRRSVNGGPRLDSNRPLGRAVPRGKPYQVINHNCSHLGPVEGCEVRRDVADGALKTAHGQHPRQRPTRNLPQGSYIAPDARGV